MKLARYLYKNQISFGQVINDGIYDLSDESDNIISFLQKSHTYSLKDKKNKEIIKLEDVKILAPFSKINSLRDAYAFREHVETCRKNNYEGRIFFAGSSEIFGNTKHAANISYQKKKLTYFLIIIFLKKP